MNNNNLSIIVIYRDPGDLSRKTQLDIFLKQMRTMLDRKTKYHIYIIEQEGHRKDYNNLDDLIKQDKSKMAKFNIGRLKNIGYQTAYEENKDILNSYYILSDVDLLPSIELLPDYLKYPKNPIHLANQGTRYNMNGRPSDFLGGVLSVNSDDFKKANGYPNNFWGWGGEDEALNDRLKEKNIKIDKPRHPVIDLEDFSLRRKMKDLYRTYSRAGSQLPKAADFTARLQRNKSMTWKNEDGEKEKKKKEDRQNDNWKKNGLNDIEKLHKVESREDNGNISHIKVFLNVEPVDMPKIECKY